MYNDFVMWLIAVWGFIMIGLLAIGGFFMFRKFLKALPREDGWSELDWQEYYIEQALPLWNDEARELLDELVSPVPQIFRDVAKQKIAGRISKIALDEKVSTIHLDQIMKGYIIATPKRDHGFMKKKLKELNIDYSPYEHLFELADDEKQKFSIFEQTEALKKVE